MTGPEHYQAAEQRLRASDWQRQQEDTPGSMDCAMHEAAMAHVHATLALAAATALGSLRTDGQGMLPEDDTEWVEACSRGLWAAS